MHYVSSVVATIGFEETSYTVTEADPEGTTLICVQLMMGDIAPGYSFNYTLELNDGDTTQGITRSSYLCPCPVPLLLLTTYAEKYAVEGLYSNNRSSSLYTYTCC